MTSKVIGQDKDDPKLLNNFDEDFEKQSVNSNDLKVPSHESYTQRRAPPRVRLLTLRRSAPFPLALGFNAAIPARSRVAEYPALFPVL